MRFLVSGAQTSLQFQHVPRQPTRSLMPYNYIRLGKANAIVAGSSELRLTEVVWVGFNACRPRGTRNEEPSKASRPYDKDRDGFVLGEGGGAIILEELEHALARGAKICPKLLVAVWARMLITLQRRTLRALGATLVWTAHWKMQV